MWHSLSVWSLRRYTFDCWTVSAGSSSIFSYFSVWTHFQNIKHLVQKYAIWNTSYESYVSGLNLASLLANKTQKIIFVHCLCIPTLAILFVNAGSLKAKLAKWKIKRNQCGAELCGLIQPYLGVLQRWKVCAATNCVDSSAVRWKLAEGRLSESWHLGLP